MTEPEHAKLVEVLYAVTEALDSYHAELGHGLGPKCDECVLLDRAVTLLAELRARERPATAERKDSGCTEC